MHQYAYGVTYSKMFNVPFYLPSDWEGTHLFKRQYHTVIEDDTLRLEINQTQPALNTIEFKTQAVQKVYPNAKHIHPEMINQNYTDHGVAVLFDSVCAYSSTVFAPMSKSYLLDVFEFSDEVKETEAYKYWDSRKGTYDIAHLRRDDIANASYNKHNPQGYSVVSKESYIKAFEKFGFDPDKIEWTSDDVTGKWHNEKKQKILDGHILWGLITDKDLFLIGLKISCDFILLVQYLGQIAVLVGGLVSYLQRPPCIVLY
jgi:hypothetical protein